MDRDAFLTALGQRISAIQAPEEQRQRKARARSNRIKEIEGIIQPYAAALTAHGVTNNLVVQGSPPTALSWTLSLADDTALILSVEENSKKEELELTFRHTAYNGIYIDLAFARKRTPEDTIKAEATRVYLDDRWSPEAFEQLVQDTITVFLEEMAAKSNG